MPTDAELLAGVVVRPVIIPSECERWDELMSTWHYLKSAKMVGEQVRYVAEYHGYWVALVESQNFGPPSLKTLGC